MTNTWSAPVKAMTTCPAGSGIVDPRFAQGEHQPAVYIATNGVILGTSDEAWEEVRRQQDESLRRRNHRLDRNDVK